MYYAFHVKIITFVTTFIHCLIDDFVPLRDTSSSGVEEGEEEQVLQAFQQVQYLVEDLDHASGE